MLASERVNFDVSDEKYVLAVSWKYNIAHEATLETLSLEAIKSGKRLVFWAPNYSTANGKLFNGSLFDVETMIVINTSPRAVLSSLNARLHRVPVKFLLHEPIRDLREFLPYYRGLSGLIRLITIKWTNDVLCHLASKIIVFSNNGENKVMGSVRNKVKKSSLRFLDRFTSFEPTTRLVSYIGTATDDHRFDAFVDFVDYCTKFNVFPGYRFGLFTRTKISNDILKRLMPRTDILHGHTLNQSEMDACYRSTEIVWCCYERTTQSGVLPISYMFGRPVLGTDRFDLDHYEDGKQGVTPAGFNPVQVTSAVEQVLQNIDEHRMCARKTFQHIFDAERSDFLA
jgi:hypothetical protein